MHLALLILAWLSIALLVDPIGEFMINDDWSFVESHRELFRQGRLIPTGWGQGGPSLIFHLVWGELFTRIFGDTVTVLRLSVTFLGIVGSCGILWLMRALGHSRRRAFLWALLVTLNPLYLSLSFTYMTDVTFAALLVLALVAVQRAQSGASTWWFGVGVVLTTLSILTRQIGLALPLGFGCAVLLCPRQWHLGRVRTGLTLLLFTIFPWILWELTLQWLGSTPVVRHEVVTRVWTQAMDENLIEYLLSLGSRVVIILLYVGFFLSPFWMWHLRPSLLQPWVRRAWVIYGAAFALFELAIVCGLVRPPVGFHRNVIANFGMGPLAFKDSYILGVPPLTPVPPGLFYLFVLVAIAGAVLVAARSLLFLGRAMSLDPDRRPGFLPVFLWFTAASYTSVIVLTGFHDRYLIPLVVLLLTWLAADDRSRPPEPGTEACVPLRVPATFILVFMGLFSVCATHDLLAARRSAHEAHRFLLCELKVDPCNVDGGFEFNGFHCRFRVKEKKSGLSWWWVEREDYLVCLSALAGYEVVRTYPIRRWLGADGRVFVLRPKDARRGAAPAGGGGCPPGGTSASGQG